MTTVQQCILHNLFCVGPSQAMHIMDTVLLLVRKHLDHKTLQKTYPRPPRCAVDGCRQPGPRSGFCSAHWIYYPEAVAQEYQSITPEEWAGIMQIACAQFQPLPMFRVSTQFQDPPQKPTPPQQPRAAVRKDRPVRHFRTYSVRDEKKASVPQHPATRCGDAGGLTPQGRPCPYLVYGLGNGKCHLHISQSREPVHPESQDAPLAPLARLPLGDLRSSDSPLPRLDAPPSPVQFTPFSGIPRLDLNQIDPNDGATTPPILPHRTQSHEEA